MKRIPIVLVIIFTLISTLNLGAQDQTEKQKVTGTWIGDLETGGTTLRLVYRIRLNENDSLVAAMDSPDQGATNVPLGRVIVRNDSLIILAPYVMANYKGIIRNDTLINGTWTQKGKKYPLDIIRIQKPPVLVRPQEPKPPLPYVSENVVFPNRKSNFMLAGTLTIPMGSGPFPAVVLITGSGLQNRDEAIAGHKPFLVIADWLTRQGIAVLRFDDRGYGKSQGTAAGTTTADIATDAEAAWLYLKSNPKIDPGFIGMLGHSEGGLICAINASASTEIAFVVSLAGMGVNGEDISFRQAADLGKAAGLSPEVMKENNEVRKVLFDVIKKEPDDYKAQEGAVVAYKKICDERKLSSEETESGLRMVRAQFSAQNIPWLRYYLVTDPAQFWSKVKCPVLALNGEKDLQVAYDVNLPAIEKALRGSGNNNVKIVSLPGLNHMFQHCTTGLVSEYSKIEETFSPEALKIISDWILGLRRSR